MWRRPQAWSLVPLDAPGALPRPRVQMQLQPRLRRPDGRCGWHLLFQSRSWVLSEFVLSSNLAPVFKAFLGTMTLKCKDAAECPRRFKAQTAGPQSLHF